MEYSDEFDHELSDLEACAVRLAAVENHSADELDAKRHFCAVLDDLINTYSVDCDKLTDHTDEVARTFHREDEKTAFKEISTLHEVFLNEVCDDYDPTF